MQQFAEGRGVGRQCQHVGRFPLQHVNGTTAPGGPWVRRLERANRHGRRGQTRQNGHPVESRAGNRNLGSGRRAVRHLQPWRRVQLGSLGDCLFAAGKNKRFGLRLGKTRGLGGPEHHFRQAHILPRRHRWRELRLQQGLIAPGLNRQIRQFKRPRRPPGAGRFPDRRILCCHWRPRVRGLGLRLAGVRSSEIQLLRHTYIQRPNRELHMRVAAKCGKILSYNWQQPDSQDVKGARDSECPPPVAAPR